MTRNQIIFKVITPLLLAFAALMLAVPRSPKFPYDYKKGAPWKHETLVAQMDFPILKSEEQIKQEKARDYTVNIPYYKYADDIVGKVIKRVESMNFGMDERFRPALVNSIQDVYQRGILSDDGVRQNNSIQEAQPEIIYIQKDKRARKFPVSEIYKLSDARAKILSDLMTIFPSDSLDDILRTKGVYNLIVPNLAFDEQTTRLVEGERNREYSPTLGYVNAGQLIVSKDEIVTAEIAQMIDSYKYEYDSSIGYSRSGFFFWLGNVLVVFMMVFLFSCVIYFYDRRIFSQTNKLLYLVIVFLIPSLTALIVFRIRPGVLYLVPFTVVTLYIAAFFDRWLSFAVYAVSLLPLMIFPDNGLVQYCVFLVGGAASVLSYKYLNGGWRQFLMALIVFAAMAATYAGFRLLDMVKGNAYMTVLFLFVASVLPIAVYPLVYIFERLFSLVSNFRLVELGETSNQLLRELEHKAPGTFQHSIQLANMSDVAARAIGANPLLIRVAALYHDIGKMNNPQCFIENEALVGNIDTKYHDGLTPQQSAHDIIRHVADGMELAEKHHIPEVISEFIITHHGTSRAGYFYNKFINEGGDPAEEASFCYSGKKPQTKEQVILMLCDGIEAAARTLQEHSQKNYSDVVERIVHTKLSEHQLDNADISFKELETVKTVLKNYLAQIYHERVTYPKRNKHVIAKENK